MNRVSKLIKKYSALWLVLVLMLASIGLCCSCKKEVNEYKPNCVFPQEYIGAVEGRKVYVTSFGQAGIVSFVRSVDAVGSINYVENTLITASEIEEGAVVFAVVGCSIKSLAECGITRSDEILRAQEFINGYRQNKFDLICWHIGGVDRRGASSDALIELLFKNCRLALFYAEGNGDLKLSDWAMEGNVPYCQYEDGAVDFIRLLAGITA